MLFTNAFEGNVNLNFRKKRTPLKGGGLAKEGFSLWLDKAAKLPTRDNTFSV